MDKSELLDEEACEAADQDIDFWIEEKSYEEWRKWRQMRGEI